MAEHNQHVPADKKDREKFSKDWKADRDFKASEKSRRFKEIDDRRRKNPKGSGGGGGINIDVTSD
jgi:hypothetical protein